MKKRWGIMVLVVALCMVSGLAVAAVPSEPTDAYQIYVNDFANVITKDDAAAMQARGAALEDASGAQVVAVTVAGLDGMPIEDYAYELFVAWKLGDAQKNNGVLWLLSMAERECYIMVGSGLTRDISIGTTDDIIDDSAIPFFAEGDFSSGMRDAYLALCDVVGNIYGTGTTQPNAGSQSGGTGAGAVPPNTGGGQSNGGNSGSFFGGIGGLISGMTIFGLILGIIILVIVFRVIWSLFRGLFGGYRRPRRWFGWGGGWHHVPRAPRHHHRPPMGPRPPMGGGPRPPMGGGTRPPSGGGGMRGGSFGGSSRGGGGGASRGSGSRGSFGGSSRGGGGSPGRGGGKKF